VREVFVKIRSCPVGSIVRLYGSDRECEIIDIENDFIITKDLGSNHCSRVLNNRDCIKLC